jgi:two-component system chemotaxis response regulator CheB
MIGIGASAGGVEALQALVARLPEDLPAVVLVVVHVSPVAHSELPRILTRSGPLPALHARSGEWPEPGRIYVAPPDHHLVLEGRRLRLTHAPRRNGVRPSIDVLFESLAPLGRMAIVAVLSGTLDDGTAGATAVGEAGGTVLVQDPADAVFPDMPANAARWASPDLVAPAAALGSYIADLARAMMAPSGGETRSTGADEEALEVVDVMAVPGAEDAEPAPSVFTCPDCGGTLWEREVNGRLTWRCRVGHEYGEASMESAQLHSLESALWAAVVALEERRDLATRLGRRHRRWGQTNLAERYDQRAEAAARQVETICEALGALGGEPDAEA